MIVGVFETDRIVVQGRLRAELNEQAVEELMDSIEKIGLTELPCVRWVKDDDDGDRAVLVVGWHRIEALKRLGHEWIECRIFEGNELEARRWEIAENLHRAELKPDERDQHIREWFKLDGREDE